MGRTASSLRYIDIFLESFAQGNSESAAAFGRHIHWGYWDMPWCADGTTRDFARASEEMSRLIIKRGAVSDGASVLDAGCGFGGTVATLNEQFTNARLVGLNIDGRQLARARGLVTAHAGNGVELIQADAVSIPVSGDSFDAVLAVESACHFASRERFFLEAFRILRPGGRLVVVDFMPTTLLKPLLVLGDVLFGRLNSAVYGPLNLQYTCRNYRDLAGATGFTVCGECDVTMHTLPSYGYTRRLMWGFSRPLIERISNNSINLTMEWLSQHGLLRYMILSFQKAAA